MVPAGEIVRCDRRGRGANAMASDPRGPQEHELGLGLGLGARGLVQPTSRASPSCASGHELAGRAERPHHAGNDIAGEASSFQVPFRRSPARRRAEAELGCPARGGARPAAGQHGADGVQRPDVHAREGATRTWGPCAAVHACEGAQRGESPRGPPRACGRRGRRTRCRRCMRACVRDGEPGHRGGGAGSERGSTRHGRSGRMHSVNAGERARRKPRTRAGITRRAAAVPCGSRRGVGCERASWSHAAAARRFPACRRRSPGAGSVASGAGAFQATASPRSSRASSASAKSSGENSRRSSMPSPMPT
jgi:hypothetical protein